MIDYRQLSDARPQDTRMLSPPPVFVRANQMTFGLVGFNIRCAEYSEYDAQIFVIRTLPRTALLAA